MTLALPADALLRPARWPARCGALMTTRAGGVSPPPFDSLDLKREPGALDGGAATAENRRRFAATLQATPAWLDQVHGCEVVRLTDAHRGAVAPPRADASITTEPGLACVVMVADCLPVLFAARDGRVVGAAHAGWRGLAGGVLEETLAALCGASGLRPRDFDAWLGACIGPGAFEVGAEVRSAFLPAEAGHFRSAAPRAGVPKYLADLPALAIGRLQAAGVASIEAASRCTHTEASRFFSFRRDGVTGRMAAAVWIRGD